MPRVHLTLTLILCLVLHGILAGRLIPSGVDPQSDNDATQAIARGCCDHSEMPARGGADCEVAVRNCDPATGVVLRCGARESNALAANYSLAHHFILSLPTLQAKCVRWQI